MTNSNASEPESDRIQLSLPSVSGYEKIARGAAEALAHQIDLDPERIEDLKTAVAEACMNAIEHGNRLERATNVTVVITVWHDKLEVQVADVGRQPMPEPLPEPGSGQNRGWGMFFIRQLMDEVELIRLPDGGNQVRMVIYLTPDDLDAPHILPAVQPFMAIQPAEKRPTAIQPVEPKPTAIQPAEKKPTAIQPAEKRPTAIQPVEPKPTAIQPAGNKPGTSSGESSTAVSQKGQGC